MSLGFLVKVKGGRVTVDLTNEKAKPIGEIDFDVEGARALARLILRAADKAEEKLFTTSYGGRP